jgi:hypothetical protein
MSTKLLGVADVASGTFFLLLIAMAGTTILLTMGSAWVARRWKVPVTLAGITTLVATLFYFNANAVWLTHGQMPVIYRYTGWLLTQPMQVITLYFYVWAVGTLSTALFWRLLVASVCMVLARYMGEADLMHPTLGFLIGLVLWLYVLGEAYFGKISDVMHKVQVYTVRRCFFWMRLIMTVGWAVWPLCYFISRFAGGVGDAKLSVTYNLIDFINVTAFVLAILTAAIKESTASGKP